MCKPLIAVATLTPQAAAAAVTQSCPTLCHQAPPSLGFSRQEYWSGMPLPSPTPPEEAQFAFN